MGMTLSMGAPEPQAVKCERCDKPLRASRLARVRYSPLSWLCFAGTVLCWIIAVAAGDLWPHDARKTLPAGAVWLAVASCTAGLVLVVVGFTRARSRLLRCGRCGWRTRLSIPNRMGARDVLEGLGEAAGSFHNLPMP